MRTLLCLALAAAVTPTVPPPAAGPDQTLDPRQAQASGRAVLETGHVDIGPRFRDGRWTIQIHDDHAVPAVWREPEDTVLRIRDTARQPVPEDEAYRFLGARPGTGVHVVPQTERPGVVWIGWNTQDPGALTAIGRGVTLSLRAVRGPGNVTVFLQSGNLGAPQVLWSSARPFPQPIWVEANAHTHANWVFGAPGVYLLALEVATDGRTPVASTVLRVAVGDATDPAAAFGATLDVPRAAPPPAAAEDGGLRWPLFLGIGVLSVLVILGLAGRQAREKRRAERAR
jgi:surface-anchored protein